MNDETRAAVASPGESIHFRRQVVTTEAQETNQLTRRHPWRRPPSTGKRTSIGTTSSASSSTTTQVHRGEGLELPRRHTAGLFGMVERERIDAKNLLRILKTRIQQQDSSVTGFNVGMNCGEDAGQTVMRAHIHLIPRRRGDTAKPRGGVRGVILDRMGY